MRQAGKIRPFAGDGKGKTASAIGPAWRAVSRGSKVLIVQFLKSGDMSGELFAALALSPGLTIKPMGRKGLIGKRGGSPRDAEMAEQALLEALSAMLCRTYDLVILDEINMAVYYGLIDVQQVVKLMMSKPEEVGLVLTGRHAHSEVIRHANHVVDMKKIRQYFDRGLKARKGIEY